MNFKNNFSVGPREWGWALQSPPPRHLPLVFDTITTTNPYSSWGWKIVLGVYICPSLRDGQLYFPSTFPFLRDGKYYL